MANVQGSNLTHKDINLTYQPYFDVLRRFDNVCKAKGISSPFTVNGFESVLATNGLVNELTNGLSDQFKNSYGGESLAEAFQSCVKHGLQEHSNPFTAYQDVDGNSMSTEGLGATAITGNYNMWSRLNPVVTAGYLARARSIEFFNVIHDDKPNFMRQFSVEYTMKGLDGPKLILPKAIRSGEVAGMLDLPLCKQIHETAAGSDPGNEDQVLADITDTSTNIKVSGLTKAGSVGNLFDNSEYPKGRHALERRCSIDWIYVEVPDYEITDGNEVPKMDAGAQVKIKRLIKVRIDRHIQTGDTAERHFNEMVSVRYIATSGVEHEIKIPLAVTINLDTGDYRSLVDGNNYLKGFRIFVRVTNVANEMESIMNGQTTHILQFDVENKLYGSIPVIPEMNADFNAGGEGVSWVAYMTDKMTENYAGIRDNDLENFIDEQYEYHPRDFELAFKLGGFKFNGSFNVVPRHPGGSDDLIGPQRMAFKQYLTKIFTRTEKWTNFDKNIERQWILMANDEDVDILPEISWQNAAAELTGNEGISSFRYGFSLDDNYGWIDSFTRRVRVIGSKDERWLKKDITGVMKTTTVAAPTTIYFPYMFRVFSGIDPQLTNRPALLFASRDTKQCSTLVQTRIKLEGNDLQLWSNTAAFAAGFSTANGYTSTNENQQQVTAW
jgi:hypothetical protein